MNTQRCTQLQKNKKTLLLLLALLCAFHPSPLCEAAVYYVKPTEPHNVTCPSEPCHTLDEYVSNSTIYFVSNTVFMFLTGYHELSYNLNISHVQSITLKPFIVESNVVISSVFISSEQLTLMFELTSDIVIRGLIFQPINMLFFITFENCMDITLTELTSENGTTLILTDVSGVVNISHIKCVTNMKLWFCMEFRGNATQLLTNTFVLLNDLNITGLGVTISGCVSGNIILKNSVFKEGLAVIIDVGPSCSDMLFVCENTYFYRNTWGGFLVVSTFQQNPSYSMEIALHNVSYIDNAIAIHLENVQNATISDCSFMKTIKKTITAINSVISFMGNVTFIDNHNGDSGGALSLFGDSRILIPEPNNTYILFENNTANNVGGAIYFSSYKSVTYAIGYCTIYVAIDSHETVFNFSMNTAVDGGNAIYGADLCAFSCYLPNGTLFHNLSQLILNVSSFSSLYANDTSVISSDPQKMCFCSTEDGELRDSSWTPLSPAVYPGQVFGLHVAALGDMGGFVKWSVHATVDPGEFTNKLQHYQYTNAEGCAYFNYSILTNESSARLEFSLTTQAITDTPTLKLKVNFHKCPLGFALSSKYGCECNEYLVQNIDNITCNITNQSIQRQDKTWIGVLKRNTSNTTLAFSNFCPFLYCNESNILIHSSKSFLDEDIQCNDNRLGVICGGCRDNFSLALGSNRCLHGCSNNSLSLLIAFAAAGIALVFFIKILNLTVSQGTINGLIFYANIVEAEQTVLFSSNTQLNFLSVFIAWVNLDLGIETCFFRGMDAYAKAWLQFVFPAYVWAIALFIIILSHYSVRASKLFGNNSVPVLATLILFTYSKLLRAALSTLSGRVIYTVDNSTILVWERDGNIQYLTGKHIPLFVFALAVLVLFWAPFTLLLISSQWLQKGTQYRVLHWVTKLIPFIDAFTGPLKHKTRYWIGALLLARSFLPFIFLVTTCGSGIAFISIIFAVIMALTATGFMYKKWYLAVFEIIYILNLGILAAGSIYVQYINNQGYQEVLVITSVGIAFLQFIVTVIYHVCMQLKEPLRKLKIKVVGKSGHNDAGTNNGPEREAVAEPVQRPTFQEVSNFREPLLDCVSD